MATLPCSNMIYTAVALIIAVQTRSSSAEVNCTDGLFIRICQDGYVCCKNNTCCRVINTEYTIGISLGCLVGVILLIYIIRRIWSTYKCITSVTKCLVGVISLITKCLVGGISLIYIIPRFWRTYIAPKFSRQPLIPAEGGERSPNVNERERINQSTHQDYGLTGSPGKSAISDNKPLQGGNTLEAPRSSRQPRIPAEGGERSPNVNEREASRFSQQPLIPAEGGERSPNVNEGERIYQTSRFSQQPLIPAEGGERSPNVNEGEHIYQTPRSSRQPRIPAEGGERNPNVNEREGLYQIMHQAYGSTHDVSRPVPLLPRPIASSANNSISFNGFPGIH